MAIRAFPIAPTDSHHGWNGMTLRDYFAAAALQGLCANGQLYTAVVDRVAARGLSDEAVVEVITALAADFADAMTAERNRND